MTKDKNNLMDKIVSLAKRRGFVFPGSEIYGGLSNSWDYGPYGVLLKNNIKQLWWKKFVLDRSDMVGLDAALIMNPKVWEASGHIENFSDPLIECKKCHQRYRDSDFFESDDGYIWNKELSGEENKKLSQEYYEKILTERIEKKGCSKCKSREFTSAKQFNLMFKTFIGPAEEQTNIAYFRPETAQAIFVNFKNVLNTTRSRVPFGIAQIGKAFRNEITPGNFIFRTREFEQMEIEYFIRESQWQEKFEYWLGQLQEWLKLLGISDNNVHFHDIDPAELAHYSKRTVDVEYKYPFGRKELYGLAYRTDFDLRQHMKHSGQDLAYTDPATNEKFVPHVIEPSLGVDRTFLAVMLEHYLEEKVEDDVRIVMKFPKKLAPVKVAVFPLLKNKPELVKKAEEIFNDLRTELICEFDDNGNIGKRYRRQDEIGTPYCVTVDFETLEQNIVTVRDRDTMLQERVPIAELLEYVQVKIA